MVFWGVVFSFSTALAEVAAEPWTLSTLADYNLPGGSTRDIITTIANWLVGIFAFFGIIGFMISGIMYLISTGNDEMITKAKNYMQYSIIGVIVGLSGYVLIQAIENILWADTSYF